MTERFDHSHPLYTKLEELRSIVKLLSSSINFDSVRGKIDKQAQVELREIVRIREAYGAACTDTAWIRALQKSGVHPDVIATAWDLKDQEARDIREEKSV